MAIVESAKRHLEVTGIRGSVKSAYHSLRHVGDLTSLQMHRNVIADISSGATFDINSRFAVGLGRVGASHAELGRSKFSALPSAEIAHTGEELARIGPCSVLHVEGTFSMGDSYLNSHCRVICGDEITIGDGVAIAWNVEILDDNRHQLVIEGERIDRSGPIRIHDDVWIGHDVSIHKGVTVHEGSVIGSDSVVLSDVPPRSFVAGTPAEVIRDDVEWHK